MRSYCYKMSRPIDNCTKDFPFSRSFLSRTELFDIRNICIDLSPVATSVTAPRRVSPHYRHVFFGLLAIAASKRIIRS